MPITIKYIQDGVYAKECAPIYSVMKKLKKTYENRTDNFTIIRDRESKMYNERIEEQMDKLMEYPQPIGPMEVEYSDLNKDSKLQFFRLYYPNKSTVSFVKPDEDPDFLSKKCYIDIDPNALKTFEDMGYEEGDIVYLENYPKINKQKIEEVLSDKYDYTFFQDTEGLRDTKKIQSATGLDKIIANIPVKSTEGGDKNYINRRRRKDKKKEKLERDKKQKQGPGKNLVELKR